MADNTCSDCVVSEPRKIKKYSNRRLYDTTTSKYITLNDVRQLVMDGVDFVVRDVSTGEDITRQILLQVIAEQESGGQPMFTKELLTQMIRFYGGAFQSVFTDYLSRTVEMFDGQQKEYQKQLNEMLNSSGMSAVSEITRQNFEMWSQMQQNLLKMYGIPKNSDEE